MFPMFQTGLRKKQSKPDHMHFSNNVSLFKTAPQSKAKPSLKDGTGGKKKKRTPTPRQFL